MFQDNQYRVLKPKEQRKYIRCYECDYWANKFERNNGCKEASCSNVYSYPITKWTDGCVHGRTIIKDKPKESILRKIINKIFFLHKLKKWIELEIEELEELEGDWIRKDCKDSAYACKQQRDALENVLYIIENKGVWNRYKGHEVFKEKW